MKFTHTCYNLEPSSFYNTTQCEPEKQYKAFIKQRTFKFKLTITYSVVTWQLIISSFIRCWSSVYKVCQRFTTIALHLFHDQVNLKLLSTIKYFNTFFSFSLAEYRTMSTDLVFLPDHYFKAIRAVPVLLCQFTSWLNWSMKWFEGIDESPSLWFGGNVYLLPDVLRFCAAEISNKQNVAGK